MLSYVNMEEYTPLYPHKEFNMIGVISLHVICFKPHVKIMLCFPFYLSSSLCIYSLIIQKSFMLYLFQRTDIMFKLIIAYNELHIYLFIRNVGFHRVLFFPNIFIFPYVQSITIIMVYFSRIMVQSVHRYTSIRNINIIEHFVIFLP